MVTPQPPWTARSNALPFYQRNFPNIQPEPSLVQLEAIPSHSVTSYDGEEVGTHVSTTSFQGAVESDNVSPEPPHLQPGKSQFPQLLPVRVVFQTPHSFVALLWAHSRVSMLLLY